MFWLLAKSVPSIHGCAKFSVHVYTKRWGGAARPERADFWEHRPVPNPNRAEPSPRRSRATIKDVASRAGVSHATVSRYLNKRSYTSAATARAIDDAIAEVGFVPNYSARSLVSQATRAVAFIVRGQPDLFFSDPNLSAMASGANAALSERNHQMLLLIVDGEASEKRVIEYVSGGAVDGAVIALARSDEPVALALARAHIPLVTASGPLVGADAPMVDTDNLGGSESITRMLAGTGREIIGEIRGPAASPVTAPRHEGFRLGMSHGYNSDLVVDAEDWSVEAGRSAASILLRRAPSLQGIVAASDTLAAGAISALTAAGRRVPEDVAVVGFDDSPWATATSPQISTVRQEPRRTGALLADVLLRQLNGENLGNLAEILPNRVVWRDSAGPPRQATR